MKRKIILITLLLMLIPVGIVVAQSSANFRLDKFTQMSGGTSSSASYRVQSVIGQPLAQTSTSPTFSISSGFHPVHRPNETLIWLPLVNH